MPKRIVFLGAGHAHLYALKRLARFTAAGHEPVVIAPGPFWYSGLATAVLGGHRPPEDDVIDVAALARAAGGAFIQDTVTRIAPGDRLIHLAGRPPLAYDLLSVCLGSVTPELPGGGGPATLPVKPISRLWDLNRALHARGGDPADSPLCVVVAGAGVTGCEVAANILAVARGLPRPVRLTLLAPGRALPGLPPGPARQVLAVLQGQGAVVRTGSRVVAVDGDAALLQSGERVPFDLLVNATGLVASPLLRASGLPVDAHGGLVVDAALRSVGDPAVFGGGDCVALQGHPLPRAGVYGVRQAPVLFRNLLAALGLARPRRFRPQRRYLWIMNLGDGTGLASWGGLHWRGRAALRLKDWIDLRFLAAYQAPGQAPSQAPSQAPGAPGRVSPP